MTSTAFAQHCEGMRLKRRKKEKKEKKKEIVSE